MLLIFVFPQTVVFNQLQFAFVVEQTISFKY